MSTKKPHHESCEILGFGVCTCDFWEDKDKKEKHNISNTDEVLASVLAICREYKESNFDMLAYIERIILGKEQYIPRSWR